MIIQPYNNDFEKYFFKLMKHINIKLVTNGKSRNYSLPYNKTLLGKSSGGGNRQNKYRNEPASIFRSINSGYMQVSYVRELV